jgi:hypothetical protein
VNLVLEALRKTDIKINGPKYTFHAKEIEFLDYIMGSNRIKIDLKKVQTIKNWPAPRNVTEIQKFIKFANFYKRFIKNYSEIAILLINLTRKDRLFS